MKSVILYGSRYGSSRRYAEKLSEMTGIPAADYRKVRDFSEYGRVIYFGGLYAGRTAGLSDTAKRLTEGVRLIVCTVGIGDPTDRNTVRHIREGLLKQLPPVLYARAEFFHLRGGIDYSRLSWMHRVMMSVLCRSLRKKPETEKTADDRLLIQSYGGKIDFVDFGALSPIAKLL